jgi:hypothetical protein
MGLGARVKVSENATLLGFEARTVQPVACLYPSSTTLAPFSILWLYLLSSTVPRVENTCFVFCDSVRKADGSSSSFTKLIRVRGLLCLNDLSVVINRPRKISFTHNVIYIYKI